MKTPQMRLLMVVTVLILTSLACSLPTIGAGERPPSPVPLSTDELQSLEDEIISTLESSTADQPITVTITEQQLHAYVVASLKQQNEQFIQNPQVNLTSGKMEVYGQVSQSGITTDAKVVLVPYINEQGDPKLDVESINLGPIPVPDTLVQRVEGMVDNMIADYLTASADAFDVTDITVNEDQMLVTGTRQ